MFLHIETVVDVRAVRVSKVSPYVRYFTDDQSTVRLRYFAVGYHYYMTKINHVQVTFNHQSSQQSALNVSLILANANDNND